jgi:hypothetical protein
MRRPPLVFLALALVAAAPAPAQYLAVPEVGTRTINLPTHLGPGFATLEIFFTHRFTETVSAAGGYDLFGFDSAADIGIGLGAGIGKDVSVELYRSSFFKQLEGSVKWTALWQGDASPVGLALRAGSDYRGATGVSDRWSGFFQVVVARRFGTDLDLFLVPSYASDTPTLRNAINVGLSAAYRFSKGLSLEAEVVPRNADARGGGTAWSVSFSKRLPGHEFSLWVGNSRATTTDLVVGTDIPGGFKSGDVRLGFNLMRRLPQ